MPDCQSDEWDGVPLGALADVIDFDCLPFELGGCLIQALDGDKFSVERSLRFEQLITGQSG
jgi:hypothetical protein